jgi:hypothetical protein
MISRFSVRSLVGLAASLGLACSALVLAQEAAPRERPAPAALVMEVKFQPAVPGKTEQMPFVQANVTDPNIELKQYGAGAQVLTNAGNPAQFIPFSAWTGEAEGPFTLTFRSKTHLLDLSGGAKIRWATKTSGFHVVRPVVKLADGSMFIGDYSSQHVAMMIVTEFPVATVRWAKLDPMRVVTLGSRGPNNEIWTTPDLTQVDEVGFADLIPGSGHGTGGWVHFGMMDVYGKAVPRAAASN